MLGVLRASAAVVLAARLLAGCEAGEGGAGSDGTKPAGSNGSPAVDKRRIPDVGEKWAARIPRSARQVVAVYGEGRELR